MKKPWEQEPDCIEWADPPTGYPCKMLRNDNGAWCGYIGLPKGHPWYGVRYSDIYPRPTVHGGLTFADHWSTDDLRWWVGFDCAHYDDLFPNSPWEFDTERVYRDADYVTAEVVNLALQAHREGGHP